MPAYVAGPAACPGACSLANFKQANSQLRRLVLANSTNITIFHDAAPQPGLSSGRWLEERPQCFCVAFQGGPSPPSRANLAGFALSALNSAGKACDRIVELTLDGTRCRFGARSISAQSLAELAPLVRKLCTLNLLLDDTLEVRAAGVPQHPGEQAVAAMAFAFLQHLEHLTLSSSAFLLCIDPLLPRLKSLQLLCSPIPYNSGTDPIPYTSLAPYLASRLPAMTALQRLTLRCHQPYTQTDVATLLSALPPSMTELELPEVVFSGYKAALRCALKEGLVTAVEMLPCASRPLHADFSAANVFAFLTNALLRAAPAASPAPGAAAPAPAPAPPPTSSSSAASSTSVAPGGGRLAPQLHYLAIHLPLSLAGVPWGALEPARDLLRRCAGGHVTATPLAPHLKSAPHDFEGLLGGGGAQLRTWQLPPDVARSVYLWGPQAGPAAPQALQALWDSTQGPEAGPGYRVWGRLRWALNKWLGPLAP
ncbi:hypothetical protein HYH03_010123 [Edaphochlamys debaryana]|uniref:Uncharacterized protein n=1 Tax=Edaphochlamys debaryana TaxID=47281 RepID=A0A835Y5R9_9CHLO|nr:hypothetical protein HYH03_010123 [Edaphochlamys debaryana]|eukprot:KAG2491554.1 hypothetical protein HYH03_010123 [Edaphochlamys debaryana]